MTKLTFKTREEYLAYRADWTAKYKQLTKDSREAKRNRKQFTWEYRPKGNDSMKRRTKTGDNPNQDSYACSRVMRFRWQAKNMLIELAEAKEMAGEQRKARLEAEQKAA